MHIFLRFEQKWSSIIVGFYLERVFQFLIFFISDSNNRKRDLFAPLEQYETPDKLLFCFHSFQQCANLFYISRLGVEGGMKNSFHPFHHPSAGVINKISVRKYNVLWLVSSWVESRIDRFDISANALSGLCKPDGRVVQQCCRTLTRMFFNVSVVVSSILS